MPVDAEFIIASLIRLFFFAANYAPAGFDAATPVTKPTYVTGGAAPLTPLRLAGQPSFRRCHIYAATESYPSRLPARSFHFFFFAIRDTTPIDLPLIFPPLITATPFQLPVMITFLRRQPLCRRWRRLITSFSQFRPPFSLPRRFRQYFAAYRLLMMLSAYW